MADTVRPRQMSSVEKVTKVFLGEGEGCKHRYSPRNAVGYAWGGIGASIAFFQPKPGLGAWRESQRSSIRERSESNQISGCKGAAEIFSSDAQTREESERTLVNLQGER